MVGWCCYIILRFNRNNSYLVKVCVNVCAWCTVMDWRPIKRVFLSHTQCSWSLTWIKRILKIEWMNEWIAISCYSYINNIDVTEYENNIQIEQIMCSGQMQLQIPMRGYVNWGDVGLSYGQMWSLWDKQRLCAMNVWCCIIHLHHP